MVKLFPAFISLFVFQNNRFSRRFIMSATNSSKQSNIELFKALGNFNEQTKQTRIVSVDEFVGPYDSLKCGNGGD